MDVENYIEVGVSKVKNKKLKVLLLSIMAGFFIALAGFGSVIVSYTISSPSLGKLLSALIFPIGLILVVLLKTELFTGNNLLIIPLVSRKISFKQLLTNWIIVYFGNLVGGVLLSLLIYKSGLLNNQALIDTFINIVDKKISLSFLGAVILGFLCNILVCIAVYLATNAKTVIEKIVVIFIPISLFILLSFEHSIANMFYLSIGALLENFNILNLFWYNLLPVTLGNILGGCVIGLILKYK